MSNLVRVNGYQDNWQRGADVVVLADGSALVTYESYINDYEEDSPAATVVMGQRFNANGGLIGGEFIIAGEDGTRSANVRAAALPDGGFVAVWTYDDYDDILTTQERVYVQTFDADGTERENAVRVDNLPIDDAVVPEVFITANGGYKVVFGVQGLDTPTYNAEQIYSQLFSANGLKVGGNTLVNVNEGQFDQIYARSATLTNGSTITIWNSEGSMPTSGELDSNEIRGTITNPNGSVAVADFSLSINYGTVGSVFGSSGSGYDVTALRDGGFVVTNMNYDWELGLETGDNAPYLTMMRFYTADGQPNGAPIIVYGSDDLPNSTNVTQLSDGRIVVVWDQDDDTSGFIGDTIYGRIFSENGTPITGRFDVGETVPSYFTQDYPEIAALPNGGFVVAFMSEYIDHDDDGVAAHFFGKNEIGINVSAVWTDQFDLGVAPVIAPGTHDPVGDVNLAGYLVDGETLTAASSVTDADGIAAFAFVWKRDGAVISGATNATYVLTQADVGTHISVDYVYEDTFGNVHVVSSSQTATVTDDAPVGPTDPDVPVGTSGPDRLVGGAEDDVISGGGGNDVILGGKGADKLNGGAGADKINGGSGADFINGGGGADKIYGGGGPDDLFGKNGNDEIWGGGGKDVLHGGNGKDKLYGGFGADKLYGEGKADQLYGGAKADQLFGGGGKDSLYGDGGADKLFGGRGADKIDGGAGRDVLTGGAGADDFIFDDKDSSTANNKRDVITDFGTGADDIDLRLMDADSSTKGDETFVFSGTNAGAHCVWYEVDGSSVVVYGDQTGDGNADFEIKLLDVSSLSASDFLL